MDEFGEVDTLITQTEEYDLPESFVEFGQRVECVGLAADEERERQADSDFGMGPLRSHPGISWAPNPAGSYPNRSSLQWENL
jgi:hypothetical protein